MIQDRNDGAAVAEPYAVSAEFYDILQAETDRRRAEHRFSTAAATARTGIVDVGAGTGIVTEVLLTHSAAPIHAIEPSTPMRVALLTRLASLGADTRARVSIHPEAFQDTGLQAVADLVVCSNLAGVLNPAGRHELWRAAATALLPGGVLLLEPPPTHLPQEATTQDLPPVRVGPDTYGAQVHTHADNGTVSVTYTYRVERDGATVRTEIESFTMWPAAAATIHAELNHAGFITASAPHGLIRAVLKTK
jgi:SAM-dependent methyltransferase